MKTSTLNKKSNKQLADIYKRNYFEWKKAGLENEGYFIIFNSFQKNKILKKISGNALKLYIYLGINSSNNTGETWYSNATIAKYFSKSERTIRTWMKELEELNMIKRMQLKYNGSSHTYLQTYLLNNDREKEK